MVTKVAFTLVSPEEIILSAKADMIVIPGETGDFGVLPGHSALVSMLRPGIVRIHDGGEVVRQIFIAGGFANVNEQGCTILSEECIFIDDLKSQNLEIHLHETREVLEKARTEEERTELQKAIDITMIKLELIKKLSSH